MDTIREILIRYNILNTRTNTDLVLWNRLSDAIKIKTMIRLGTVACAQNSVNSVEAISQSVLIFFARKSFIKKNLSKE